MFVASDSIRRAFGIWRKYSLSADSCCPFSDYGWGHNKQRQARCFSCYSQLFASISGKLLNVHVVDRGGHELSDSIFYLCPHITRNSTTQPDELLGHWSCCDSTCTKKFGTIYQVRRGIQAMLTIWICHFVRLSRRFETIWFTIWHGGRFSYANTSAQLRTRLRKSSAFLNTLDFAIPCSERCNWNCRRASNQFASNLFACTFETNARNRYSVKLYQFRFIGQMTFFPRTGEITHSPLQGYFLRWSYNINIFKRAFLRSVHKYK